MNTTAILALIRNDLRLHLMDRRAVIVGILVPIRIAAFFGYVFGGNGNQEQGRLPVAVVDEDQSAVSRAIVADLGKDAMLQVAPLTRAAAREQVRKGKQNAAAIFPQGFGEQSVAALFSAQNKPKIELLVDPSQQISARLVEGLLAQYSMKHISKEAFNGVTGQKAMDSFLADIDGMQVTPQRNELKSLLQSARRLNTLRDNAQAADAAAPGGGFELGIPYEVAATPVTSGDNTPYNSYAHSFAGMSVQFILFAGIDAGIVLLLTRQRGIWQRIRSAPLRKGEFILARALATLGRSAAATRGIAIMAMLLLVMLGGAWVPAFVFPKWLQDASLYTPTRWAVDGLDAMTWRGLPFADAWLPTAVLCGCAILFLAIAVWRFRWEE